MSRLRLLPALVLAAAFLALLPAGNAQQAVPPAGAGSPPPPGTPMATAPNQTGQITLDAVVVPSRKKGPHFAISGLQEKDFTVLDNGRPQKLVGFRAVDTTANPNAVHVLLVVDMVNADFDRIAYMREQLGEFLHQNGGQLLHPTSLAVMTESGVSMMGGSTHDGNALNASFQKVRTDLREIGRDAGFYGAAERIEMSLTALRQIVAFESTRPGRKIIIVISPGWRLLPMAGVEEDMAQRNFVFNMVTTITSEIQSGHITLYSVDPLELGNRDPFFYQAYRKPVTRPDQGEYPVLALQIFAEHSGGQAITMGRDVLGELNAAMRDAGPYYELTYQPQPSDKANEYHAVQVKVDQPDETARSIAGYYSDVRPVGGRNTQRISKAPKP